MKVSLAQLRCKVLTNNRGHLISRRMVAEFSAAPRSPWEPQDHSRSLASSTDRRHNVVSPSGSAARGPSRPRETSACPEAGRRWGATVTGAIASERLSLGNETVDKRANPDRVPAQRARRSARRRRVRRTLAACSLRGGHGPGGESNVCSPLSSRSHDPRASA